MWQQSYSNSFAQYSSTFATDGWTADAALIDVTGIDTSMVSFYDDADHLCDTAVNLAIMDTVPGQLFRSTF